jgi:hypothetical protein
MSSFDHIPAVVFASGAGCQLEVDLFPGALADVGNEKITSRAIKGETPRIAHAICPNLI